MHVGMLWRAWASVKPFIPSVAGAISFVISLIAITLTLKDRRPRLILKARKGNWCLLKANLIKKEIVFTGIIEVYNASNRANAIRDYRFWGKREGSLWEKMESELYKNSEQEADKVEIFNQTPFTVPPYSGVEMRVQAISKGPQPYEMEIKIEVEDLFGKHHSVEVKAVS
jgi:hypothetical protein